jgi:hypothetical protein
MAWQDDMVQMLRVFIFDLEETPTYSDARLEEMIIVSAHLVVQEIDFTTDYTVSIMSQTITPDPATNGDTEFQNFVVLKAACLADQSTLRSKVACGGVTARLGGAALSTSNNIKGYETLLTLGPCAAYQELKWEWELGNANAIRAILSPFTGNTFDARDLRGGSSLGKQFYRDNMQ